MRNCVLPHVASYLAVLHSWAPRRSTVSWYVLSLWHDQNCRLWSVLQNCDLKTRTFFAKCALPVDVFHFKCKHKHSDVVCSTSTHCNPYIWQELRTPEGKWRFNSSAAEQANIWAGKYQPIVCEMQVDRYNFFLDEMVRRRNQAVVDELRHWGHAPYRIPKEELLGGIL